jgi:N-hydroxyarylamine O-acetyltransferase
VDPEKYLQRIGFEHPIKPDLETLDRLVKAHLSSVPFENLDQQMRVPVSTALPEVYNKLVLRRRGGWCFELNGLFGWLLGKLGFDVTMLAGFVGPDKPSPDTVGDHMFLLVNCDGPWIVDVGFGGGAFGPIPLQATDLQHPPYSLSITPMGDGWFKYSEATRGNNADYWFTLDKVERAYFAPSNHRLQTDPNASFRRTLTAQRRLHGKHIVLRGIVLKTFEATGVTETVLPDAAALVECLGQDFGLDVPDIARLWPALKETHHQLFGA